MTTEHEPSPQRLGVVITVVVLLGTVVFMSAFLGTYKLLGVGVPYVGLFFLLYWAAMLHQDFRQYLPSILGALLGTVLGWALIAMPHLHGLAGSVGSYAALGAVLFCYISNRFPLFVSHGTMLFVLLAVIPPANVAVNIVEMIKSLLLAAVFMGVVAWGLRLVQQWRAKSAASAHT